MIQDFLIFIITFLIGYFIGSRETKREIKNQAEWIIKNKPEPGVVRHLTDEEIAAKKNPILRGNLEAFNEFFKKFPIIGKKINEPRT